MRTARFSILLSVLVLAAAPAPAHGQEGPDMPPPVLTADPAAVSYEPLPGYPRGTEIHVLKGDPRTGPFEIYLRLQPGVTIPMHFHSSAENSVGIQGNLVMRHMDGTRTEIGPGSYMFIPWRMPHEPTCPAGGPTCIVYFSFDRAFDTTWVGAPPANPNPMPAMER